MVEMTGADVVTSGGAPHSDPALAAGPSIATDRASQFRGRAAYAIDDKGRLTLPPQMRRAIQDGANLVVLDGRAVIWDEPTYRDAIAALNRRVRDGELAGAALRGFLANTHQIVPDAQGRVVVPPPVRIEAGLERDVLVLGVGPRIELVPLGDGAIEASEAVDDAVVDALDRDLF